MKNFNIDIDIVSIRIWHIEHPYLKLSVYVLVKILKFCTDSSAKSYQCKFGISEVLRNRNVSDVEELGDALQDVIHYYTLRGKFSSVHPELRRDGIIKVEVGKDGLHFIPGAN